MMSENLDSFVVDERDDDIVNGSKRKHVTLTISQKVDIIRKLDEGCSARSLSDHYGVGTSTVYDIKKQKKKILKFYADYDSHNNLVKRKTMHRPRSVDLDKSLYKWYVQRRSNDQLVSGPILIAKAKQLHRVLRIAEPCEFSTGWLQRFKLRHGIQCVHNNSKNRFENIFAIDSDQQFIEDASTSQNYLNQSSSSPNINSYNLNAQNSGIDTKPITVNHADMKKQQLEFLEAQMHQADVEAKKRQAEAKKRQAELAEAKKLAEKLAEEERLRKEAENKVYKYMVLNHEKKVLETLRALWKGNQFCDATLQNEFISIPVHKIVLIACCPKILETYDYIMKDTNVQVCFPRKVTAEALKAFVDYLYNGSLNLSRAILDSMEYLSGMLGLDEIRQLCNQFRSDMMNDSFCLPDKTIVHVNNPREHSTQQMSYNDHIIAPPPIVRPSTHNVAAPTAVSIQLSNFQDVTPVTSVHSNNFNLFSESHADSVLTEVSHIKLEPEPEVDLTAEDCTEIKQESLQSQLYGDPNCKFDEWPSTVVEPHHPPPPPSSSLSQPNFVQRNKNNNFEMSTVDLSLAPLNAFQKQTSNNTISTNISSSGVITISPSNSPCPSPRLTESPSDVQTLQISNTHTISTANANPFPVSLISTNGQSISLTDQDNKRKLFADYDSKDDRKRPKIILN